MQAAFAQRRDQASVVAVAVWQCRATGQHDARMEYVGPREFHLGRIVSMKAIEVAETGGPEVLTYVEKSSPPPAPGRY